MTGAWVGPGPGLVSTIVLEMGGSSDLCAMLKTGEPVILMAPRGARTHIAANETVILIGGGWATRSCFDRAGVQARGSKVLYLAGLQESHRPLQSGRNRKAPRTCRVVLR